MLSSAPTQMPSKQTKKPKNIAKTAIFLFIIFIVLPHIRLLNRFHILPFLCYKGQQKITTPTEKKAIYFSTF
jgi:hypothetical protein